MTTGGLQNMILYSTVSGEAKAEQIIEKSKFIAHVKPISSREEGDQFIAKIKKEYKDATHNVPAMVLGDQFQIQWASDDGEPQGTSGAPIVQMLVQEGITNVVVVVTRYFGGIKLGTGGLVRAYTGSVKLGLEAAGICDVKEMSVFSYNCDYGTFNKIQNFSYPFLVEINEVKYTDEVYFKVIANPADRGLINGLIADISSGTAVLNNENFLQRKIKR